MFSLETLIQPAISGGVCFAYNYFYAETNPAYLDTKPLLKYSAICAAATLVTEVASDLFIPQFSNRKLLNLQKVVLSGAGTSAGNLLGQRFFNDDGRIDHNLMSGAISGAASSAATSFVHSMYLKD